MGLPDAAARLALGHEMPWWMSVLAAVCVVAIAALLTALGFRADREARARRAKRARWVPPKPGPKVARPWNPGTRTTDPVAIATEDGWVVAWSHGSRDGELVVQVATLDRDGSLRGDVRTLSTPGRVARSPALARDGARVAVAWQQAGDDHGWPQYPWFAVVDGDNALVVPARAVGDRDDETASLSLASDGRGWGVGWTSLRHHPRSFTLARLTPNGEPRSAFVRVPSNLVTAGGTVEWVGDSWLAAVTAYDAWRDRSAVLLHRFDHYGELLQTRTVAASFGQIGNIGSTARGAEAWFTWGDDAANGLRHDPMAMRVAGGDEATRPVRLGPRRSGDVPLLARVGDGWLAVWPQLPDEGAEASLQVQVLDDAGAALAAPRNVGPAQKSRSMRSWGFALAASLDEREALAVWTTRDGDDTRLIFARLGPDGVPLAPPALLPLP